MVGHDSLAKAYLLTRSKSKDGIPEKLSAQTIRNDDFRRTINEKMDGGRIEE